MLEGSRVIGSGAETGVQQLRRPDERWRRLVVKEFSSYVRGDHEDDVEEKGFSAEFKERLQLELQRMQEAYGTLVVPTRIIENPDEPGRFFMVQYYITGPEGEEIVDVFDYSPSDYETDESCQRLLELAKRLKANIRLRENDQSSYFPDMMSGNIVLDQRERAWIVDTGGSSGETLEHSDLEHIRVNAARLEVLGGMSVNDIKNDPLYTEIFAKNDQFKNMNDDNPNEFYVALGEISSTW